MPELSRKPSTTVASSSLPTTFTIAQSSAMQPSLVGGQLEGGSYRRRGDGTVGLGHRGGPLVIHLLQRIGLEALARIPVAAVLREASQVVVPAVVGHDHRPLVDPDPVAGVLLPLPAPA